MPTDLSTKQFIANLYLLLGRNQEAIQAYEALLQQTPEDAASLNNLATLLTTSDPKKALSLAEKAQRLRPGEPGIMDTLGWILVNQGETQRGLDLLRDADRLAKDQPEIRYHYAVALLKSGRKEEGRRELERLVALGKDFPGLNDAKALLKKD
jgi:tetratricopeptide (TPR) repeat protein